MLYFHHAFQNKNIQYPKMPYRQENTQNNVKNVSIFYITDILII